MDLPELVHVPGVIFVLRFVHHLLPPSCDGGQQGCLSSARWEPTEGKLLNRIDRLSTAFFARKFC